MCLIWPPQILSQELPKTKKLNEIDNLKPNNALKEKIGILDMRMSECIRWHIINDHEQIYSIKS